MSFDNSLLDQTHSFEIRQREFAWLTLSGDAPQLQPEKTSPLLANGAKIEKLAGGFFNISGGAVDRSGNFYFVDAKWQTIYRWSTTTHQLSIVRDNPLDPVQLAFDKSGDLIVISYQGSGTVCTFNPDTDFDQLTLLKPESSQPRPGMIPILPVDYWRNENDFPEAVRREKPYQFVSLDHSVFIPAGEDFVTGKLYYGAKMHDALRAFGVAPATVGQSFYVEDQEEQRTFRSTVDQDGTLTNLRLFVNVGGESVTEDTAGNVYIAAGQIYVFNPAGTLIDTIDVPERPSQILFGGVFLQGQNIRSSASSSHLQARPQVYTR